MKPNRLIAGSAAILACSLLATAGNVPQYSFTQVNQNFKALKGATPVANTYDQEPNVLFLGDEPHNTAFTGQGYPIGFDFRFAGQVFNQFAINNNGSIFLGRDQVAYPGFAASIFHSSLYMTHNNYIGLMLDKHGVKSGSISYLTEGEPGNRTMTLEFKNMNVREDNSRGNAIYHEQIVLHENGKVEIRFCEEESPYGSDLGLMGGIAGFGLDDMIILTTPGLGEPVTVSTSSCVEMTDYNSMMRWLLDDIYGDSHMNPYSFSLTFEPTGETGFTSEAPTNLAAIQTGDVMTVSCDRAAGAPATMILMSTTPFDDTMLPAEGQSYKVKNLDGSFATKFGDATMIYYGNAEHPIVNVEGLENSTEYYLKAIPVNGYPSYDVANAAVTSFVSSHPAPRVLISTTEADGIKLKTTGDYDVIIATTTKRVETLNEGTDGIFGLPAGDCAVGDEIDGGGRVIYVGPVGEFTFTDFEPNRQHFFRAWSLNNGRVSQKHIISSAVPSPSMPFEPCVEDFSVYQVPMGWTCMTNCTDKTVESRFIPRVRGGGDHLSAEENCIAGLSVNGTSSSLLTPSIPVGTGATLSFEWAMETTRDTSASDNLTQLPEGNDPGVFGMGHAFTITCGPRGSENKVFETSNYTGTMYSNPNEPDKNVSGTSEWLPVSVELPDLNNARFNFRFSTEGFSTLFLRKITVNNSVGVKSLDAMLGGADIVSGQQGALQLISAQGGDYTVATLDGRRAASLKLEAGEGAVVALPAGIYVVAGQKVVVK